MKLQDLFEDLFPPLYHGTASDQLVRSRKFRQGDVYLTVDKEQAAHYAHGVHLGGSIGDIKYIITVYAKPGKVYDADSDIQQIIMDEHEQYETIEDLTTAARKQGYNYVTFHHPSVDQQEDHFVVISLFPNRDLKIVGVDRS